MSLPNTDELKLTETGLVDPNKPPPITPVVPPNNGKWVTNPFQTFASVINAGGSRTWMILADEAQKSGFCNTKAVRNDPVIREAIRARVTPTVQLETSLEAQDEDDPRQQEAVEGLGWLLDEIPNFQGFKVCLMEDLYYGKSAVEMRFAWDFRRKGQQMLGVREWWPVNGDKLVRHWGGGWGVLVGTGYEGKKIPTELYAFHEFTPEERRSYVISMFDQEDADFFSVQEGGKINGCGFRSQLYHIWWQKVNILALVMDFMQLAALGFNVYFYAAGDMESLKEVKAAAESQIGQNAILFPRLKEQGMAGPGVERHEVGVSGAAWMFDTVPNYYDALMRRVILNQSLTSETGRSEIGGDAASALTAALSRVVKFDAHRLEWVLYQDLLQTLCAYNYPGVPCPRLRFSVDKPDATKILEAATQIFQMGGQLDLGYLLEVTGIPPPEPGKPMLSQAQPQQPVAATDVPEGTPLATPAGPAANSGDSANGQPSANGNGQAQPHPEEAQRQAVMAMYQGNGANGAQVPVRQSRVSRAVRRYAHRVSVNGMKRPSG